MTRRSMPMPRPPAGGMPWRRARTKSSSIFAIDSASGRLADAVQVVDGNADVLLEQLCVRRPLPRRRVVDSQVAERQLHPGSKTLDAGHDEAFGEVHHRAVVAVGLV